MLQTFFLFFGRLSLDLKYYFGSADSCSLKRLVPQKQIYVHLLKPISTDICEKAGFSQDMAINVAIIQWYTDFSPLLYSTIYTDVL